MIIARAGAVKLDFFADSNLTPQPEEIRRERPLSCVCLDFQSMDCRRQDMKGNWRKQSMVFQSHANKLNIKSIQIDLRYINNSQTFLNMIDSKLNSVALKRFKTRNGDQIRG